MLEIREKDGKLAIVVNGLEVGEADVLVEDGDDYGYLERLDIDEKYRNNGYGTKALRALAEKFERIIFAPDNEDAKRLYSRIADELKSADYDSFGFAIDQGYGVYEI